jgi:hypothetical protein
MYFETYEDMFGWHFVDSKTLNEPCVEFLRKHHTAVADGFTIHTSGEPITDEMVMLVEIYSFIVKEGGWDVVLIVPMKYVNDIDNHDFTKGRKVMDFTKAFKI